MLSIVLLEQRVLNCIWDSPDLLYRLDRNYFVSSVGQIISEGIRELYEADVPITVEEVVTLTNSKHNSITKDNLQKMREKDYDLGSFDYYFKTLKKNFAKTHIEDRLLKDILSETSSKGELNVEKLRSFLNEIEQNLELIEGKESLLRSIDQVITNYRGVLIKRRKGEYKFPTGDSHLDRYLAQGFPPGEITTIFGATGVGKSMYALNLISRQINKRIPSLYYTLEMSEIATMDRLICIRQKISSSMFKLNEDGELPDISFKILEKEAEYIKTFNDKFYLVENPAISLSDFEVTVKEAQKRMNTKYLIATVDLFTMLNDVGQDAREIEDAMNRLHSIVKRTGIHCVIIVQANRSADSARIADISQISNLRPSLNTIKNAQAMAERSRLVLSVFRPKYYASRLFPESEELELMDDILEIQILKQSNGETGKVIKYLYDADTFRVLPYFDEEDENLEDEAV